MSAAARLAKLEGALTPKGATLLWLTEAHQFPTLPAYVAWLVGQPDEAAPFRRVPEQAERAVRAAMRGEPRSAVESAAHQAVRDAVFLVELVTRINVDGEETLRVAGLRRAAFVWEGRALAAEAGRKAGSDGRHAITLGLATWHDAASTWQATLDSANEARRLLEGRYFDGRDVMFPDLADQWAKAVESAAVLAGATDRLATSTGARARRDYGPRGKTQTGLRATASAGYTADLARQTARSMLGDPTGAPVMIERPVPNPRQSAR